MSAHLRKHHLRQPSLEPTTRAALKSLFQRQSYGQVYHTLPLKSKKQKNVSQASGSRRSIRSIYSNMSAKSRQSHSRQSKQTRPGKENVRRGKVDPITKLFRFLDRRKSGRISRDNLARHLDSTCERML
jgi:hypothetical protein